MFDILFLGKELSLESNERFQIHYANNFAHKKDLDEYIAKNCFEIIIVDVHHPLKPSTLRKLGHKGLMVACSENQVNKTILKQTLTKGFNMYFSFEHLQDQLKYIVEAFSNIPEFEIDYSQGGFDMEIYDQIIKHAGFFIYQQFAELFFYTHPTVKWAFVSQDMLVIDHESKIEPGENELSSLMMKTGQYVFLFSREQTVSELIQ